jgi:hypothetical protein
MDDGSARLIIMVIICLIVGAVWPQGERKK